jgi:hypothetical protein
MDVAAESLVQDDTTTAGVVEEQKGNGAGVGGGREGGSGANGIAKSEDNKFQKAIAAWRSVYSHSAFSNRH